MCGVDEQLHEDGAQGAARAWLLRPWQQNWIRSLQAAGPGRTAQGWGVLGTVGPMCQKPGSLWTHDRWDHISSACAASPRKPSRK